MDFLSFTKKQIWVIILIFAIAAMLIDLNSRISTLQYLKEQKSTLESDVTHLQATSEIVQEQINYAQSDSAVEEWARQQGMMRQQNDHVIIPIPGTQIAPTATIVPTTEPTQMQNWQVWKQLLFN